MTKRLPELRELKPQCPEHRLPAQTPNTHRAASGCMLLVATAGKSHGLGSAVMSPESRLRNPGHTLRQKST